MNILILIIGFPLIGFILLSFSQGRWSENFSATIGVGSIGLATLATVYLGINFFHKSSHQLFNFPLWTWISIDKCKISFSLTLDGLSLTMLFVIIGVGFLIHVFASWYMRGEEGYSRFFAYTNLFVSSMAILVLSDNLLMMYFGWEVVGLCSYLLISFYHMHLKNIMSAMKAFIITRIGDVFLAISLFILYNETGTFVFRDILDSVKHLETGSSLWWATLMLLGGAVSKSAQLPFQTWLPDAMVGPTPVSALVHSATMVTAGVYLVARTHNLFLATPEILHLSGVIGVITLVLAGFSALVQTDIKRILAYSTMSQLGYMFLALGVQAWHAAIFHLIVHAFFKGLLFLSSGSLILTCRREQNIFKMGGLRKSIFPIYICFLVGGSALSSLPLVTSSFFSKEEILIGAASNGYISLMIAGIVGTFITSLYAFRMIFITFHGEKKIHVLVREMGISHYLPLGILLTLSTFVGKMIPLPLQEVLPSTREFEHIYVIIIEIISSAIVVVGVLISSWLWLGERIFVKKTLNTRLGHILYTCMYNAWGFDWLYDILFVKPFLIIARILKCDPLHSLVNSAVILFRLISQGLLLGENGYLRWYMAYMSFGTAIVLTLMIFF